MKIKQRILLGLFVTIILCFNACRKDNDLNDTSSVYETQDVKSVLIQKEKFGIALINSMKESPILRQVLKKEALKMFNKDYEVLVYSILNTGLEDGLTFEKLIAKHSKDFELRELLDVEPTLTILIPKLPYNSFSAEVWDVNADIPAVAIQTNKTSDVPLIMPSNERKQISSSLIPGFPVLVVKNNERLVSSKSYPNFSELKTRTVYTGQGVELKFWSDAFDGEIKKTETRQLLAGVDPVLKESYEIYEKNYPNLNGWQRDYIYYGIEPNNLEGAFCDDFQEHIRSFTMSGKGINAYNKISGQTGRTSNIKSGLHSSNTSHWTGGFFEFKVRAIINAKNGVRNELVSGFSLEPSDLFVLNYEKDYSGLLPFYVLTGVENKEAEVDVPIIKWDLDRYPASIKVEVEEVDLEETTIITETKNVTFATNFEMSSTLGKKVKLGLRYGSGKKLVQTHTVQRTFSQGNDFLGSAIVNFADKVVLKRNRTSTAYSDNDLWITRDYKTGHCCFSLRPVRVQ